MKTNLEKVQEIADEVGGSVYEDYSGRFMYGATCLGIVCLPDKVDDVKFAARDAKFPKSVLDNMGLDYIVYWPSLKKEVEVENG